MMILEIMRGKEKLEINNLVYTPNLIKWNKQQDGTEFKYLKMITCPIRIFKTKK